VVAKVSVSAVIVGDNKDLKTKKKQRDLKAKQERKVK